MLATLSQAKCLHAVGELVYVATTFGCLVVIDSTSLSVTAVCQPNPHVTAIIPLTADQSQPCDMSHDQPTVKQRRSRLMTIGRGYVDLVQRTVAQYKSETSTCDGDVLLVWSDVDWTSHTQQQLNIKQ